MRTSLSCWLHKTEKYWERLIRPQIHSPSKVHFQLNTLEDRIVPNTVNSRPLPLPTIYVGSGPGSSPIVRKYDVDSGDLLNQMTIYEPGFTGGVRVATADINRDAYPDLVTAPGPGGGPRIQVFDYKTDQPMPGALGSFYAFETSFTGGVNIAVGDVNNDGYPDIIAAAGSGGGPRIRVFSGKDGSVLADFFAYDADFRGGVSIAAADLNGDGKSEIVVGAGDGGGPHVKLFDISSGTPVLFSGPIGNFMAFDPNQRGGVNVASGDVNGDNLPDIIVGEGVGQDSRVRVFSGKSGAILTDFQAFDTNVPGGVQVSSLYADNDNNADIVVGTGAGVQSRIRIFSGASGQLITGPSADFDPTKDGQAGGIFIAAGNDPPLPTVGAYTYADAWEGSSSGAFAIYWMDSGEYHPTVTVNFTLSGTAVQGLNYTSNITGSVVIPGGTDSSFAPGIIISPLEDGRIEPDQTVTLTLQAGTGYIIGDNPATLTIHEPSQSIPTVTLPTIAPTYSDDSDDVSDGSTSGSSDNGGNDANCTCQDGGSTSLNSGDSLGNNATSRVASSGGAVTALYHPGVDDPTIELPIHVEGSNDFQIVPALSMSLAPGANLGGLSRFTNSSRVTGGGGGLDADDDAATSASQSLSQTMAPVNQTNRPVRYTDGVATVASTDIPVDGDGLSLTRTWSNNANYAVGQTFGNGWVSSASMPRLVQTAPGHLALIMSPTDTRYFYGFNSQPYGDGGSGTYPVYLSVFANGGSIVVGDDMLYTDSQGNKIHFALQTSSSAVAGSFLSSTSVDGITTSVISHTNLGQPTELQQSVTINGRLSSTPMSTTTCLPTLCRIPRSVA